MVIEKKQKVNEEISLSHARQIFRMLPGGTDILGIFVSGNKKVILENQVI